jgi:hypothetical protein
MQWMGKDQNESGMTMKKLMNSNTIICIDEFEDTSIV